MDRIKGLDSIRAVCAFWVVMGHFGGPPITTGIDESNPVGKIVSGICNNLWNAPAAVIVFFVISGFCIHYPFALKLQIPSLMEYAARRYLRIGIPLAVAVMASPYLGVKLPLFNDSILWSLIAELVYYTMYPALLSLRRRAHSWSMILGFAFLASVFLVCSFPGAKNYPSFGASLNWLMGLPCWIVGCVVAERTAHNRLPVVSRIWLLRVLLWGATIFLSILRFHSPLGYPWTLNIFAFFVGYWLLREISFSRDHSSSAWLEWAGQWSYSVYLVHVPAHAALGHLTLPNLGPLLNWVVQTTMILIVGYLFYLCVEYPGHRTARRISKLFSERCKPDATSLTQEYSKI